MNHIPAGYSVFYLNPKMAATLEAHLFLLRPFFELMRGGVVISLGGGVAVDARLGLPITSLDIDGRVVAACGQADYGHSTHLRCHSRITEAVAYFRTEWVRYGHTISDQLDAWYPEPILAYDFDSDPELRKSARIGEYVGSAWIGTITNDYMNKLIVLVKSAGRAHKLVEVSYGGECGGTQFVPALGVWCDRWEFMGDKFTQSLRAKSRVLQRLLGDWFNVEPTTSGERYRAHLESDINGRLSKWNRACRRLELICGELADGGAALDPGGTLAAKLAQLDADLAHYNDGADRLRTARASLESVRAAEEAERAARVAASTDRAPTQRIAISALAQRITISAPIVYPRPSNVILRGDPTASRVLEETERAARIWGSDPSALLAARTAGRQFARAAEEEERRRRTMAPIACMWLRRAVIAVEEEERRRRIYATSAPPEVPKPSGTETCAAEEAERDRRCARELATVATIDPRQLMRTITPRELARGSVILSYTTFRRATAAKINRLLAVRLPVEATISIVLRAPCADIWHDPVALRSLLVPHENALRALLDSAQFTNYWAARCDMPLRCNMTPEEIARLQPVAVLNEILERWLWVAAGCNLLRLRAAVGGVAAAAAKKQHSDNMTAELFRRLADVDAIAKELESLRALNDHIDRIAPGVVDPTVAAVRNWLAQEPWAHVARCTLAHIHREKCDIAAALERALAAVSALHVTCAARTMANPATPVWRQCYGEFAAVVKEAIRATSEQRKSIRTRPDWFQRKLNVVEINPAGTPEEVGEALARGLRQQEPTSRAWSAYCRELVAAEQFSERLMADRSEGLRGWQCTLRVTHETDWSIMYIEGILQHVSKINTLAEFMGWVVNQC